MGYVIVIVMINGLNMSNVIVIVMTLNTLVGNGNCNDWI